MKLKIIFLFLSLPIFSFAKVEIVRENGKVYLYGDSCDHVYEMASALRLWKEKVDEVGRENLPDCNYRYFFTKKWNFHIDITDHIPTWVKERGGKCNESIGPNCWNSTLVANGYLPFQRYTHENEISNYMNSPLCRERKRGEKAEPGDIIRIRYYEPMDSKGKYKVRDSHTFIHVNDEIAFSKNGSTNVNPPEIQTLDGVFKTYGIASDSKCKRIEGMPHEDKNNVSLGQCNSWANYYKCESIEDWLSKKENKVNEDYLERWESFDDLGGIECSISEASFSLSPFSDLNIQNIESSLKIAIAISLEDLKKPDLSEENKFLLNSIIFRAESNLLQLGMLGKRHHRAGPGKLRAVDGQVYVEEFDRPREN